jgi:thymidylate synthase (FAD)
MDSWNEVSRRYVTMKPEFYIPDVWRSAPENKKQGSGVAVNEKTTNIAKSCLRLLIDQALENYNEAIKDGVCPEQARLFLPAYAMYTIWRWSASLQSIAWFLKQRLADDAQVEIRYYANAVEDLIRPKFQYSMEALLEN